MEEFSLNWLLNHPIGRFDSLSSEEKQFFLEHGDDIAKEFLLNEANETLSGSEQTSEILSASNKEAVRKFAQHLKEFAIENGAVIDHDQYSGIYDSKERRYDVDFSKEASEEFSVLATLKYRQRFGSSTGERIPDKYHAVSQFIIKESKNGVFFFGRGYGDVIDVIQIEEGSIYRISCRFVHAKSIGRFPSFQAEITDLSELTKLVDSVTRASLIMECNGEDLQSKNLLDFGFNSSILTRNILKIISENCPKKLFEELEVENDNRNKAIMQRISELLKQQAMFEQEEQRRKESKEFWLRQESPDAETILRNCEKPYPKFATETQHEYESRTESYLGL